MGKKAGGTTAEASPGRIIAHPGLPAGWIAVEKVYQSGGYAGKTYIRFQNEKHRNVLSVKQVIKIQCEENGGDPDEALKEYESQKERKKEEQAKEREKIRQEQGRLQGQQRQDAIETFRSTYGQLDGATVCAIPGWRGESKLLEKCGQICARYFDPDGRSFSLLKDIEAMFGMKMQNGEEIPDVEAARNRVPRDENGKALNIARRENIVEDFAAGAGSSKKRKKSEHVAQIVSDEDYRETEFLAVLGPFFRGVSQQELVENGARDGEELEKEAFGIHQKLLARGFADPTDLVYVTGSRNARTIGKRSLDDLSGIYFQRGGDFNGRCFYQKVFVSEVAPGQLACVSRFIFWSNVRSGWKIGVLDDQMAGCALCVDDKPTPMVVEAPWQLLEPKVDFPWDGDNGEVKEEPGEV